MLGYHVVMCCLQRIGTGLWPNQHTGAYLSRTDASKMEIARSSLVRMGRSRCDGATHAATRFTAHRPWSSSSVG